MKERLEKIILDIKAQRGKVPDLAEVAKITDPSELRSAVVDYVNEKYSIAGEEALTAFERTVWLACDLEYREREWTLLDEVADEPTHVAAVLGVLEEIGAVRAAAAMRAAAALHAELFPRDDAEARRAGSRQKGAWRGAAEERFEEIRATTGEDEVAECLTEYVGRNRGELRGE